VCLFSNSANGGAIGFFAWIIIPSIAYNYFGTAAGWSTALVMLGWALYQPEQSEKKIGLLTALTRLIREAWRIRPRSGSRALALGF